MEVSNMTYVINNNFPNFIYAFDSTSHRILLSNREGKVLRSWNVSSSDGNRNFLRLLSKGWRVFHPGQARVKREIAFLKAQDREIGFIENESLYTAEEIEAFNKDPEVLANREKFLGQSKAKKTIETLKAQDREIGLISMATASLYTAEEVEAFNKDPEVLANREKYFADI
jgi:hypothetical protein